MSLNDTPDAGRTHIGIFGRANTGKSSLINALTGQDIAITSPIPGTTTDPVRKAMELLPLGPVLLIDTPGLDDAGVLGERRVKRSHDILESIDIALLVTDGPLGELERGLIAQFSQRDIAYLIVHNKLDQRRDKSSTPRAAQSVEQELWVSALSGENINALRERLARLIPPPQPAHPIVADLLCPHDVVLLVIPIDQAAPKGRLILPQQQTIREILEAGAFALTSRETELPQALSALAAPPRLVITDSQVFRQAAAAVPPQVPLTSFSILFARHKGYLEVALAGLDQLQRLDHGDTVLISEGCTHHRQCDDIGTVKLPRWIRDYTGKKLRFITSSGSGFPDDLSPYQLVVHCGACMLQERAMLNRIKKAQAQNVPITNYGIIIAHMQGILQRSLQPLYLPFT